MTEPFKIIINQSVAILIDGNNIEMSLQSLVGNPSALVDFDKLIPKLLQNRGLSRLIYFREGVHISGKLADRLLNQFHGSVIPCHKSADIPLTIKATQIAQKVDTIIILSGDSDYVELVRHLRGEGVRVEIAAIRQTTARILIEEADHFTPITEEDCYILKNYNSQNSQKTTQKIASKSTSKSTSQSAPKASTKSKMATKAVSKTPSKTAAKSSTKSSSRTTAKTNSKSTPEKKTTERKASSKKSVAQKAIKKTAPAEKRNTRKAPEKKAPTRRTAEKKPTRKNNSSAKNEAPKKPSTPRRTASRKPVEKKDTSRKAPEKVDNRRRRPRANRDEK